MRILHCSDSFWPRTQGIGGIQIWLTHLVRQQVAEGHAVAVVTWGLPGSPAEDNWNGIEVFRWPVSQEDAISSPEKMRDVLIASEAIKRSFAPDVLHLHPNQLAHWIAATGSRPSRSVVTAHVPVEHHGVREKMYRRVLEGADVIAVSTEDLRESYELNYPQWASKLKVIAHGLATPSEPEIRSSSSGLTFLCLGRLVPEKGFDIAIRALAAANREDFRLVIAGDGPALPELRELAQNLGVEDQVEIRGWVDPSNVPACLKTAHVLVVPSIWREPFGLVALEAGQMGLPVIASKIGGLPEIICEGENGLLIPPGDFQALTCAMHKLAENPDLRGNFGRRGRERAEEKFSIQSCSRAYHAAYLATT